MPIRRGNHTVDLSAPRVGPERWLVSYADFITLMLAFFTALYAIAAVETDPAGTPLPDVAVANAPLDAEPASAASSTIVSSPDVLAAAARARALAGLRDELNARLKPDIDARFVTVRLDGRGLVISLHERGAFPVGSAELSAAARELIDAIGLAIAPLQSMVRVEGHTDDVPIATARYRSNWELSTARATNVVTYLVERVGMAAERFAVAGYGEFRPLVSNDSDENRAKNRRVDIVVLSGHLEALEPVGDRPEPGGR